MMRDDGHAPGTPRGLTRRSWLGGAADMFARSLQGATPEEAVKWAAAELRKIYGT